MVTEMEQLRTSSIPSPNTPLHIYRNPIKHRHILSIVRNNIMGVIFGPKIPYHNNLPLLNFHASILTSNN